MRLHQLTLYVLFLLFLIGCKSRHTDNNASTPAVSIDTAYLWHQIDSIDYFSSISDTTNCKRILAEFKKPVLVKHLPRIVYQAFFYASIAVPETKNKSDSNANEQYLKSLYQGISHLAKENHSNWLEVYAEYLPTRRLSKLGNNVVALPRFLNQLERFKALNDAYGQGLLNKRIGLVYYHVYKEYEKAAHYFKEALHVSPGEVEKIENSGMLVNIFFILKEKDSLQKYRQIQHAFQQYNDDESQTEVDACYYILNYANGQQQYEDSIDRCLQRILEFYRNEEQGFMFNDVLYYATAYCNTLIDNGKLVKAKGLLDKLNETNRQQHFLPNTILLLHGAFINYYEHKKEYTAAYHYLKDYQRVSQILSQSEGKDQVELARVEYEMRKAKDAEQKKYILEKSAKQKFRIIAIAFIINTVLLIFLVFYVKKQSRLRRRLEAEQIRTRLSRDLHDDIGSTLSSINILSRTAQVNLHHENNKKTKSSLEKINERSQRLLDNMSDIIWNIRPGNDTIEEVMSRMREYATTLLEAKGIDYVFNFPKEKIDCSLTMEVKNNMYLIFKEAVNNLSKYADCTQANLSLTFDEKHIYLTVQDNGKGFNEAEIIHRGGLRNMQQRAEEINGTFCMTTTKGVGTIISLILPRFC
ncbi:MAG: sensor histidine kinase [Bacteroidetes bacterium]|nr:sensor histidine kinase [Bacteroidota bacterium]